MKLHSDGDEEVGDELADALRDLTLNAREETEEEAVEEAENEDFIDLTDDADDETHGASVLGIRLPVTSIPDATLVFVGSQEIPPVEDAVLDCFLNQGGGRRSRSRKVDTLSSEEQTFLTRFGEALAAIPQSLSTHSFVEIDGVPVRIGLLKGMVAPASWLDDEAINGYLSLLAKNHPEVKFMSTFFYPSLLGPKLRKSYSYDAVSKWTRKSPLGVFGYRRVMIPINQNNSHWSLIHIDMESQTIEYYDSLGAARFGAQAISHIKRYLRDEFEDKVSKEKEKEVPDFDSWNPILTSVPRQQDGGSCGVFVCYYCQCKAENRKVTFSQQDIYSFRRKMAFCLISPFAQAVVGSWEMRQE
ncbi:hypothetical protein HDU67_005674 [Dinochytrium kinnereticum]|nr:hypothetical protein HDU67_005674 [Dinochytrium kinnereticum]